MTPCDGKPQADDNKAERSDAALTRSRGAPPCARSNFNRSSAHPPARTLVVAGELIDRGVVASIPSEGTEAAFATSSKQARWPMAITGCSEERRKRPLTPERSACPRGARTACLGLGVCEQRERRPALSSGPRRDFVDAYGQAAGRAFGSTLGFGHLFGAMSDREWSATLGPRGSWPASTSGGSKDARLRAHRTPDSLQVVVAQSSALPESHPRSTQVQGRALRYDACNNAPNGPGAKPRSRMAKPQGRAFGSTRTALQSRVEAA